jgi:hypothetical protein
MPACGKGKPIVECRPLIQRGHTRNRAQRCEQLRGLGLPSRKIVLYPIAGPPAYVELCVQPVFRHHLSCGSRPYLRILELPQLPIRVSKITKPKLGNVVMALFVKSRGTTGHALLRPDEMRLMIRLLMDP